MRRLLFIHWFDWIEPNTTEDPAITIRNVNVARRMIANPPFKNISAATNSAHSSSFGINLCAGLGKLAGLLFHSSTDSLVFRKFLLRSKLSYVLSDFHGTKMWSAH